MNDYELYLFNIGLKKLKKPVYIVDGEKKPKILKRFHSIVDLYFKKAPKNLTDEQLDNIRVIIQSHILRILSQRRNIKKGILCIDKNTTAHGLSFCSIEDEYDFEFGHTLAYGRMMVMKHGRKGIKELKKAGKLAGKAGKVLNTQKQEANYE